jgi:hypothetical protein
MGDYYRCYPVTAKKTGGKTAVVEDSMNLFVKFSSVF